MPILNNILIILGILMLIEALFVLLFPNFTIKLAKNLLKKNNLTKIAVIELIIAIILIILGYFL